MKVIHGNVDLENEWLTELPDLSDVDQVRGNFALFAPKVTSLAGCPREITGNFSTNASIRNFIGGPDKVGSLFCTQFAPVEFNTLTPLRGFPETTTVSLLSLSRLKTLEGMNLTELKRLSVNDCGLESFVGGPKIIHGKLRMRDLDLKSLDGFPTRCAEIDATDTMLAGRPITIKDITSVCEVDPANIQLRL